MLGGNTEKALKAFRDYVVSQARANLTRGKQNTSSELYNSIGGDFKVNPNSIELNFKMLPYGEFQDRGVKGVKSNYIENKNTPFSYKSSSNIIGFEAATGTFAKWAKAKRFRLRDEKGRFTKGNYKTIGFILAQSVKNKGIRATMFFTKPFRKGVENLNDDLKKAYGLDVVEFLEFSFKKQGLYTKK